jgi:hypothetical protein
MLKFQLLQLALGVVWKPVTVQGYRRIRLFSPSDTGRAIHRDNQFPFPVVRVTTDRSANPIVCQSNDRRVTICAQITA